jgi:hypothetical protein
MTPTIVAVIFGVFDIGLIVLLIYKGTQLLVNQIGAPYSLCAEGMMSASGPGDAEGEFTKWLRGWALKSEASRTIRSWSKTQSKNKVSVIQEGTSGM